MKWALFCDFDWEISGDPMWVIPSLWYHSIRIVKPFQTSPCSSKSIHSFLLYFSFSSKTSSCPYLRNPWTVFFDCWIEWKPWLQAFRRYIHWWVRIQWFLFYGCMLNDLLLMLPFLMCVLLYLFLHWYITLLNYLTLLYLPIYLVTVSFIGKSPDSQFWDASYSVWPLTFDLWLLTVNCQWKEDLVDVWSEYEWGDDCSCTEVSTHIISLLLLLSDTSMLFSCTTVSSFSHH